MSADGGTILHRVDAAAVRTLAERLCKAAGNIEGDFVFATIKDTGLKVAPLHYVIPNGPNAAEEIVALVERVGGKPHTNSYYAGALFKSGAVTSIASRTKGNVAAVLCAVCDFDGKHDPATRHERLPMPPTAEVESSAGNFQCQYWFDHAVPPAEAGPTLYALTGCAGADDCKSTEHLFRLPGTWNWPDPKKIAAGRSPEPFKTRWSSPPEEWDNGVSHDDLRAAIVAKDPKAFECAQSVSAASNSNAKFEWAQRKKPAEAANREAEADVIAGLSATEDKSGDPVNRSDAAMSFWSKLYHRNYSPDEAVTLAVEHKETYVMSHFADDEKRIREDVQRAWPKIIATAKERAAKESTWVEEMNRQHAVVLFGNKTLIATFMRNGSITFSSQEDFKLRYANRTRPVVNDDGETEWRPIAPAWLKHKGRREALDPGVVFDPSAAVEEPGMLNLWRGFAVEPKPGDWSLMRAHIRDVICSGDETLAAYFLRWMAYAVQHPGEPGHVAIVLKGKQGVGKGIVVNTFGELFGRNYHHITHKEQLIGRFNMGLATSVVTFLDEALWAAERQAEGKLKAIITERELVMEAKNKDAIMVRNCTHLMIASNNEWAAPVGIDDRRFFVLAVPDTYKGDFAYFKKIAAQMDAGGREAMLCDLKTMDLSGFDPRVIPETAARIEQKERSLTGTEAWLAQVLHEGQINQFHRWDDEKPLAMGKEEVYLAYSKFSEGQHEWKLEAMRWWARRLKKMLGASIYLEHRPCANGVQGPRQIQFAPLAECRAAFDTYLGGAVDWTETTEEDLRGIGTPIRLSNHGSGSVP